MKRGFTLIEILVGILIISLLATIALFGIGKAQAAARDAQRQQIMNGIRTALERYYADNQAYYYLPAANNNFCGLTTALVPGYLSTQPIDPNTKVAICAAGDTNPTKGGATYTYSGAASSYSLILIKESGGTNTFTNPQ